MKIILSTLFVCSWLLVSGYLLWQDQRQWVGTFDQHQQWQASPLLSSQFAPMLQAFNQTGDVLLHVEDPACRCHRQHISHRQQLQQQFADLPQYTVTAEQLKRQGFDIPAAPMVILLKQQQLLYAGPYNAGPLCGDGDSLIERIIIGDIQLAASWLNGESSSCRCLQTS